MDPLLTTSYVLAFVLVGFAIFGKMLVSKPKSEEPKDLLPETIETIAALSKPTTEPEPVWTSPISTWERFSPLYLPVASFVVFVAALTVCVLLYRSFGGFGIPYAQDVVKTPADFRDIDLSDMRDAEPAQFKMPDPPKVDFSRKR